MGIGREEVEVEGEKLIRKKETAFGSFESEYEDGYSENRYVRAYIMQ